MNIFQRKRVLKTKDEEFFKSVRQRLKEERIPYEMKTVYKKQGHTDSYLGPVGSMYPANISFVLYVDKDHADKVSTMIKDTENKK